MTLILTCNSIPPFMYKSNLHNGKVHFQDIQSNSVSQRNEILYFVNVILCNTHCKCFFLPFYPRSSALENLLNIAGKDWDTNLHVSKTTSTASDFTCPAAEGHYPDPKVCNIYHQCAGGTAHATTCQPGLAWNVVINMCDWEANVDCDINR